MTRTKDAVGEGPERLSGKSGRASATLVFREHRARIGAWLRNEGRREVGYSQEGLAEDADVSVKTIQNVERGRSISPATWDRLLGALNEARSSQSRPGGWVLTWNDLQAGKLPELVTAMQPSRKEIDTAAAAWQGATFRDQCAALIDYYTAHKVPLFQYDGRSARPTPMPLYAPDDWADPSRDLEVRSVFMGQNQPYQPDPYETRFLDTYLGIRKALGHLDIWNGDILQLLRIASEPGAVRLGIVEAKKSFFASIMCQYSLEHELNLAIHQKDRPLSLPRRDRSAFDAKSTLEFSQHRVARVGVSTLLLLRRKKENDYLPIVGRRSTQSMIFEPLWDPLCSGIWDVTSIAEHDKDLELKFQTEGGEELFRREECARRFLGLDPRSSVRLGDWVNDYTKMKQRGDAEFHVTGFCIDLIRIVPEITCLAIIHDPAFYAEYAGKILAPEKRQEHDSLVHMITIPRRLRDFDGWIRHEVVSNPERTQEKGFDPYCWTLPGGFCFYQALRSSACRRLLR